MIDGVLWLWGWLALAAEHYILSGILLLILADISHHLWSLGWKGVGWMIVDYIGMMIVLGLRGGRHGSEIRAATECGRGLK
jgi:hypothetical protein